MEDSPQYDLQSQAAGSARNTEGRGKAQATVDLIYFGFGRVTVRGAVRGHLYEFTRHEPVQPVNACDAVSMLKTRLFRRIR